MNSDFNNMYGDNYANSNYSNYSNTANTANTTTNYIRKPEWLSEEIISLNEAIELIKKSVGDEREDEIFYEELIKSAPTMKEKDIIKSIRDDERKHNQILRNLYYKFTGEMLPAQNNNWADNKSINTSSMQVNTPSYNSQNVNSMNMQRTPINNNSNYKSNLEKALFGELEAVKKYRKILGTMPDNESYTLLMSIMTDELRHADKYNYLISNNR